MLVLSEMWRSGLSTFARHFTTAASRYHGARRCDVAIVGGGHNGLVSALLLARQGLKVSARC